MKMIDNNHTFNYQSFYSYLKITIQFKNYNDVKVFNNNLYNLKRDL